MFVQYLRRYTGIFLVCYIAGGNIATSHRFLLLYLEEKLKIIANISLNIADVRDVATSEILLMESAKAEGRYDMLPCPYCVSMFS